MTAIRTDQVPAFFRAALERIQPPTAEAPTVRADDAAAPSAPRPADPDRPTRPGALVDIRV